MPVDYLEEIKRYLRITFIDHDEDLLDVIQDGMAALEGLLYPGLVFNSKPVEPYDGQVNSLLKDYVRYSWNGSSQYFEEDYHRAITRLSLQIGAARMAME